MKKFKVLFYILVVASIFIIYNVTKDNKVYYVALGDYLSLSDDVNYTNLLRNKYEKQKKLQEYNNFFIQKDYRINDMIYIIQENTRIKGKNIKNLLIKADLVTLSIGNNDLIYKFSFNSASKSDLIKYVDEMMIDMDKLLSELRTNCKEKIVILSFYCPNFYKNNPLYNEIVVYANKKLKKLSTTYQIDLIDIHSIINQNSNFQDETLYKNKDINVDIYNQINKIAKY